jgi:hypothetical protein
MGRRRSALLAELRALVETGALETVGRGPAQRFRLAERPATTSRAAPETPPPSQADSTRSECVYHAPPDQGGLGWALRVPGACVYCLAASR